jgi:uncharacterized membrane protein YdbT with pleckstrin-like domain
MSEKPQLKRRAVRLFAVPLIIIAVSVVLTDLDILDWPYLWIVPVMIAVYVGVDLLFLDRPSNRANEDEF